MLKISDRRKIRTIENSRFGLLINWRVDGSADQFACAVAGRRGLNEPEPVEVSAASGARSSPASASLTRTSTATYLTYSDSSSRKVEPLVHHGSSRHLSPTTANGINVTSGIACDISAIARGI